MLSRETLWLRFGGMALVLSGLIGGAWIGAHAPLPDILLADDRAATIPWAVGWFIAANACALGLILLLAGLRQVSLRTSAQARRGALVRLAAANLLLVCLVFAGLQDSGALDGVIEKHWYLGIALLLAFVLVARRAVVTFRSSWKYEARTADEERAADPRPPVVYLRSFDVDPQVLVTGPTRSSRALGWINYAASVSPEQEMAFILSRVGPVIAIGKPGERLPELGAARRYVPDSEWRAVVGQMMTEAALVVIRAGNTDNLWWETEQAMARCAPNRIIIVEIGPKDAFPEFDRRFAHSFGTPVQSPIHATPLYRRALRLFAPFGRSTGRILYFDENRTPYEERLQYRITWTGFPLVAFRPYRDSLQHGFRTVFTRLGLQWTPQRSLTTAVLLALFGGIFGLHHFYTGRVRIGLWYLAFFWLGLPIVLGWIDAARLALLDDEQFQKRVRSGTAHAAAPVAG